MKAKKNLVAFLICCLCLSLTFCLGVAAEDGDGNGMSTFALVSLIVGGVALIAVIVLCIVKRQRLMESLRAYRSEMKKITWFPWKSVVRSTVFVIVVVLATAVLVGLLDVIFFESQHLLTGKGVQFPW